MKGFLNISVHLSVKIIFVDPNLVRTLLGNNFFGPNSGGNFGAQLIDLSKAFECLPHDKLHAYGLDMPSLKLLHSYLTKRRQRVKINNTYSSWSEILFGVPQGSILGPLLFNVFLCDLFFLYPILVLRTMLMITLLTPPINILKLY